MKLTKKQIEILTLMNLGWELGKNTSTSARNISHNRVWWLQKGGIGRGGESKEIHGKVNILNLYQEKLILSTGFNFPSEKYYLTKKGKKLLNESKN